MSRVLLALLSVYGIKFKACQPLIFKRLRAFFDEKSRSMYSNHPGEKQRQNLAVSNRLTRLASVALRWLLVMRFFSLAGYR